MGAQRTRTGAAVVDRDDVVLVVIDVQDRLAAVMKVRDEVVAAVGRLIRAAAVLGIPVVVTRQYPAGLGDTVDELSGPLAELAAAGPPAIVVDKASFCCGKEPGFEQVIEATGRRQLVLCGMETHICVTQTALDLLADGREVHVAADACCSRRKRDHVIALDRLRAAGAVVTVTESVMYEAVGRAGTPEFKALLGIVKDA